jgi:hypothetical protein
LGQIEVPIGQGKSGQIAFRAAGISEQSFAGARSNQINGL